MSMRFSARTNWDTAENDWSRAMSARRERGLPIYDLTAANPTQCGFSYDLELLGSLTQAAGFRYAPDARGLREAREAVCSYYRDHCLETGESGTQPLEAEQIVLTTSTSEAYSFLFRLLCDPGDEVLIAQPSYPLFDFLATLDDVKLVSYPLFYDHGWHLDLHGLGMRISPRTRAIVVVHPNNPTGHFTTINDRRALEAFCKEAGLALIVDEVFLDYSFEERYASFMTGPHPVLTFVLSGLSKVAGLPQMKLSWIAAAGPEPELKASLERLEVVADTFLSLSTPLQLALPSWLLNRKAIQDQIQDRVRENLATLDSLLDSRLSLSKTMSRLAVEGGWYVTLRAPALREADAAAIWLLAEHGVAVHPGRFFGMTGDGYFVVSLLPDSQTFTTGTKKLVELLSEGV